MWRVMVIAGVLSVFVAATGSLGHAASVRKIYFSNGQVVPGQRYRSVEQLPSPVTTFVKGRDKTARLFVVFGDMEAHRVEGELKAADGHVVRRVNQTINAYTRAPAVSWRFVTHGFGLGSLKPGEYTLDLRIDGESKGAYKFSLGAA